MKHNYLTISQFKRQFGGSKWTVLRKLLQMRTDPDGNCLRPICKGGKIERYKPLYGQKSKEFETIDTPQGPRKRVKEPGTKAFLCPSCLGHFHPMVDSPMESSKIEPEDWFEIMFKMLSCRNG